MKNANKEKPEYYPLVVLGEEYSTLYTKKYKNRKPYAPIDNRKIYSFIPGTIQNVFVEKDADVKAGEKLLTLQAMKMDNEIIAPVSGKVKKVYVKPGQMVTKNELLIELL